MEVERRRRRIASLDVMGVSALSGCVDLVLRQYFTFIDVDFSFLAGKVCARSWIGCFYESRTADGGRHLILLGCYELIFSPETLTKS